MTPLNWKMHKSTMLCIILFINQIFAASSSKCNSDDDCTAKDSYTICVESKCVHKGVFP